MRFNLTVAAIFLAAMVFSVIETVDDTRERVHSQTVASVETIDFLIQSQIARLKLQWQRDERLPTDKELIDLFRVDLYNLRHLDIQLLNASGELLTTNKNRITDNEFRQLPGWYVDFISAFLDKHIIEEPISINETRLGRVVIQHDVHSEMVQIWSDSMTVLISLSIAFFVVTLLTAWLASLWLRPLSELLIKYRRNAQNTDKSLISQLRMPFVRGVRDEFHSLQTQLDNYNRHINEFNEKLFYLQESERRRISAELHDELGQYLTAMQFDVMAINNARDLEQAKVNARAIGKMSRQMTAIVRDMLNRLRPPSLESVGLETSLQDLITEWQSRYPQHTADMRLALPAEPLNEQLRLTVYRMVQEALTNTCRYAGDAVHVKIDIDSHSGMLNIRIHDDGKGFDQGQHYRGFGLDVMQERVQAVRGIFSVETAPGTGVSLKAEIPLNNERTDND